MKDIRIFVASSRELERERNYLAFLVLSNEEAFAARGLRVRLAKWEYVDPMMTACRTEDRYLKEMYDCDAALILFKNVAGKYTCEEFEKALEQEQSSSARLKAHQVLFSSQCVPDSEASKLKETLPAGSYSIWSGIDELKSAFLSLVDKVSESPHLADSPSGKMRTVSAFIAADDELASDRNAFADAVLNLNEILGRRHIRIRLRFYEPSRHHDIIRLSEMALVLYHTTSKAFGMDQMKDVYERTMKDENPRRLYVFFRNEDDGCLDESFLEFRESFEANLGHFFCRFENVDTLKLNFLLSLEDMLGCGAQIVKLDGRMVKADGEDVAEITKLPMVANNRGLKDLLLQAESITAEVNAQQEICKSKPDNAEEYDKLFALTIRKSNLDEEVNRELSLSFDLVRRMAIASAREANETICKARELLDKGKTKEALTLLDEASAKIDGIVGDISNVENILEQKLKTLEVWVDVELFHVDTVLVCASEPIAKRLLRAEAIFNSLIHKASAALEKYRPRSLAKIYSRFANIYFDSGSDNTSTPIELLKKALRIYQILNKNVPGSCQSEMAYVYLSLAVCETRNNHLDSAQEAYLSAKHMYKGLGNGYNLELSQCYMGLGAISQVENNVSKAQEELTEALKILREQVKNNVADSEVNLSLASTLNSLGVLFFKQGHCDEAEPYLLEAQDIGIDNNYNFAFNCVAMNASQNLALLYHQEGKWYEAEERLAIALRASRCLARERPCYTVNLLRILCNLGKVHLDRDKHAEAEKEFGEAVDVSRRLTDKAPDVYQPLLVESLFGLSGVHSAIQQYELSERELVEALNIVRRLTVKDPARYEEYLAISLNRLGNLHSTQHKYELAEREYSDALEIQRRLANSNRDRFEPDVVTFLCNWAKLYDKKGEYEKSEQKYSEAIEVLYRLVSVNPTKYESEIATCMIDVANLHYAQGKYILAEQYYSNALEIRRRVHQKSLKRGEMAPDLTPSFWELLSDTDDLDGHLIYSNFRDVRNMMQTDDDLLPVSGLPSIRESDGDDLDGFGDFELGADDDLERGVAAVLDRLGKTHQCMKRYADAEKEFGEALEIRQRLAEWNHSSLQKDVADTFMRLARLHMEEGRVENAERECSRALNIRRQIFKGKDDVSVADSLNYLAHIHLVQKRDEEAEQNYLDELAIYTRLNAIIPDKYHPEIASCRNNLGYTLFRLERYEDAVREYTKAIVILKGVVKGESKEHRDNLAIYYFNLGYAHIAKKMLKEAEVDLQTALEIRRDLALNAPEKFEREVTEVLSGLARLHVDLGRLSDAEQEYREVIDTRRRLVNGAPGKNDEDVLVAFAENLCELGDMYFQQKRYEEAEETCREELAVRQDLCKLGNGGHRKPLAKCHANLGVVNYLQGRYDVAEHESRIALDIYRDLVIEDPDVHEKIKQTSYDLVRIYKKMQRPADTEVVYKDLLDLWRKLATTHPELYEAELAATLNNLAILHESMEKLPDAEAEYKEALDFWRKLVAAQPELYEKDLAIMLNNLAILHENMQKLADAEVEYKELLVIRRKLATTHPELYEEKLVLTLCKVASLHKKMQLLSDAEAEYKEALAICRQQSSENTSEFPANLVQTLKSIALIHVDMGYFEEAERDYVEVIEVLQIFSDRTNGVNTAAANVFTDLLSESTNEDEHEQRCRAMRLRIHSHEKSGDFAQEVAILLGNLSGVHESMNRFEDAEQDLSDALLIRRRLAKDNPSAYTHEVADSLVAIAVFHYNQGRTEEAEQEYLEALMIFRNLSAECPGEYDANVATLLRDLALLHVDCGQVDAADDEWSEALNLRRSLAQKDPAAFEAEVANTLNEVANFHYGQGRAEEAEQEYLESLEMFRTLSGRASGVYDVDIAFVLNQLARMHMDNGLFDRADREFAEALMMRRRFAQEEPMAFDPEVANTLNDIAYCHVGLERLEEAEMEYSESLEIFRRLAAGNPEGYANSVAVLLGNIAFFHREHDKPEQADMESAESLEINARILMEEEQLNEAEKKYKEALEIRHSLASANSQKYNSHLANTLVAIADLHNNIGRKEDALGEYKTALNIWRCRSKNEKGKAFETQINIARILNDIAKLHLESSQFDSAEEEYSESLGILRGFGQTSKGVSSPDIVTALYGLADVHRKTNRTTEARRESDEADAIVQKMSINE